MDVFKVQNKTVDEDGLPNHNYQKIKCACCEKELVSYVEFSDIVTDNNSYTFQCPYCEERSFKHTFNKKVSFNPLNSIKIVDIKELEENEWLISLIKK